MGSGLFQPLSMALQGAGAVMGYKGSLAAGDYAAAAGQARQTEANYEASQLEENASTQFGARQQDAFAEKQKANLLASTATARAAGGGVNAGVGSPVTTVANIQRRGEFNSLMDMFEGKNRMTGMLNQAQGIRYGGDVAELEGQEQKKLYRIQGAGTLASGFGNIFRTAGMYAYPSPYGGSMGLRG